MSTNVTVETAAAEEDEEDEFVAQGDIAGDVLVSDEMEGEEEDPESDAEDVAGDGADAQESAIGDSLRNFIKNRDAVRERLRSLSEARATALCNFLLERCFLVVVEAPRGDQAHRVFSVLHTRGLDLSDTDVLKAEVLGGIHNENEQLKYQAIWERWEDQLGRGNFERLFSHLRMISRKSKQQLSIAEELRKSYPIANDPAGFLVEHVLPKNIPRQSKWSKLFKTNRAGHVHRIGNLLVLSRQDNDAVRNIDFDDKCKIYFAPDHTSPFGLKQAIQGETKWTPKVIDRRSRTMVGRLAQVWGLQVAGTARRRP